jgi:hypothetical protein
MPRGAKTTKPTTISKIIACNENVYLYANYFVRGISASNDNVVVRVGMTHRHDGGVSNLGRLVGKIVDTELIFDSTELKTSSIPAINAIERAVADVLAYLNKIEPSDEPIATTTIPTDEDDDDESVDVSDVKQVLVIPMTKASKLVGAKIGKDTISSVSLFTLDGEWRIAFAINDGDCYVQAKTLFGCVVEVSEE